MTEVRIDPRDIGYIQFPEFHKMGNRRPKAVEGYVAGSWDQVLDTQCFWGARYEDARKRPTGMALLSNYQFQVALEDRFTRGKLWQETEWFNWLLENKPSRYKTEKMVNSRLLLLETLYEDCISGRYRFEGTDLPLINVGREGRIAIEDGRHRICVARVAGLAEMPVHINAIHPDATQMNCTPAMPS